MTGNGTLYLFDPGNVLFDRQVVDLADALPAYADTPVDDPLHLGRAGDSFVLRETKTFLDGNFCIFKRKDANRVRQVLIGLVLLLETDFDVLAYIEMLVVAEVHECGCW